MLGHPRESGVDLLDRRRERASGERVWLVNTTAAAGMPSSIVGSRSRWAQRPRASRGPSKPARGRRSNATVRQSLATQTEVPRVGSGVRNWITRVRSRSRGLARCDAFRRWSDRGCAGWCQQGWDRPCQPVRPERDEVAYAQGGGQRLGARIELAGGGRAAPAARSYLGLERVEAGC